MKIFFWGDTAENVGPSNINKGMMASLTGSFLSVRRCGKYRELIIGFWKLLQADMIVISGVSRKGYVLGMAAKRLGKQMVYIMHGCGEYEIELNHAVCPNNGLAWEAALLENADLLLPVSRKFMQWVHAYYPQYKDKTAYLFNGIDPKVFSGPTAEQKKTGSVIAVGGFRKEKNNLPLVDAVAKLNGKANLTVYGVEGHEDLREETNVSYQGQVPNEPFVRKLSETELFVLNSVFETFSITVVEALACGCSILVSEIAGITDLLALEETDIIHDPMDVDEIRRKMEYLLEHPNNKRIVSQFDINEWTFDKMVRRLEQHCKDLLEEKNK